VCTLIPAFASVYVVGFLIKDVVNAIDQEIERESDPDQDWQYAPIPEVTSQPHANDSRSDGVDPQNWTRDFY
jgi:hypothetical protein